jgi:hypothetical protein
VILRLATILSLMAGLGACSVFGGGDSGPTVVSANPTAVTLRFKQGDMDKATARAQTLCAQHGATARMLQVNPDGDERIGNFECVPRM